MANVDVGALFSVFDDDATPGQSASKTKKRQKKDDEEQDDADASAFSKISVADILQEAESSGLKRHLDSDNEEETTTKRIKEEVEDLNLAGSVPRIQIHTVETLEACTHEVAFPPDGVYAPLQPRAEGNKPAKEYPFSLDPFQKEAILCLENNQSVLVSAHTSAGKTVVAEYAISMSLRDKQRVIYTTPIKALSNQKYREFYEEFKDVGLITGDVTINPTASCLIMTTEILRNMLYRGSEVLREVGWVVFDEIHYMRDKERGVVWEESLILLPDSVHYVFLSATIPNARQFAEWICHLHKQPCHVVYTDYRPVPLQHFIYPAGGEGIFLVVDEQGTFREDNFGSAMAVLQNAGDAAKGDQKGRKGNFKGQTNCFRIVKMIMERNLAPVIIFSFSKRDCEGYAMQMAKLDFNSPEEKRLVDEVFNNAMDVLSEEDRRLPQVENVLPLLRRGVGIHHGGLLPILKETIEILFGEGLVKALFATETFAMGLNMPARTVLFTSARKFDGKEFRWVTSGEYIQMSGRAGRRGLDDKGIVIQMIDEKMSPSIGKELVCGSADPINSAFHLTYNMVLNLLRVEEINPEYVLERSFFQFQNYSAIPELCDKLREAETNLKTIRVSRESEVSTYYMLRQQLKELAKEFQTFMTKPQYLIPFLQPGRMVVIKNGDDEYDWGVVVNYKKEKRPKEKDPVEPQDDTYVVDALLHVTKESAKTKSIHTLKPVDIDNDTDGEMQVVPVLATLISKISSVRLFIPEDLRPPDNRRSVLFSVREVKKRFSQGIPLLDPVNDMKIKDKAFHSVVRKIKAFEARLYAHPLHEDPDLDRLYERYCNKIEAENTVKSARDAVKQAKSVLQMDELRYRKRILRRLGYSTAQDVIEVKGRVACELSSADELLLTELMFNGVFNTLTVGQSVALLSCFVCDERTSEMPRLAEDLSGPLRQLQEAARRIAKVTRDAKLEIDEDTYVESFRPSLMDVVHEWCKGVSFLKLCEMTDIFEGSIIRCMRRLEELLRQMCQAAKTIGNTELENKFSEGIRLLKRDIVFAASLYL